MRTYRIKVLHVFLAMLVAVLLTPATAKPPDKDTDTLATAMSSMRRGQGQLAPDFTLQMMDGEAFRLADNVGKKVIVLNFFATWCGPCKREMPELSAYYDKHREEPFVIIGVDAGEGKEKVEKFIEKYGVTFPVGIDHDNEVVDLYGVRNVPVTVFIGADGTIKLYQAGPVWDAEATFGEHLAESLELIESGKAIDRETYLKKLAERA